MNNKPREENVLGLVFDKSSRKIKSVSEVSSSKLPERKSLTMEEKILRARIPRTSNDYKLSIRENKELMKRGKRRCKVCGEVKDLKWFGKKDKKRYLTKCRSCTSINAENRVLYWEGLKRCKVCKRILPLLQFNIKSVEINRMIYRDTVCKDCFKDYYKNRSKKE